MKLWIHRLSPLILACLQRNFFNLHTLHWKSQSSTSISLFFPPSFFRFHSFFFCFALYFLLKGQTLLDFSWIRSRKDDEFFGQTNRKRTFFSFLLSLHPSLRFEPISNCFGFRDKLIPECVSVWFGWCSHGQSSSGEKRSRNTSGSEKDIDFSALREQGLLKSLTKNDLCIYLEKNKLPKTGKKEDLIERICSHLDARK